MKDVLFIGYGAIGQYVCNALQETTHSRVVAVLCRPGREDQANLVLGESIPCVTDLKAIPPVDCAIECAGHQAFTQYVPGLLQQGVNVIAVSSGALADQQIEVLVEQSARQGHFDSHEPGEGHRETGIKGGSQLG